MNYNATAAVLGQTQTSTTGYTREQLEQFSPGQAITASYTVEEREAYWKERLPAVALDALSLFKSMTDSFLRGSQGYLSMGEKNFSSINAQRILNAYVDIEALDKVIRETYSDDQLFNSQTSNLWQSITANIEKLNENVSTLQTWSTAQADLSHMRPYLIEQAVESGDLDDPIITPEMKRHYIQIAYTHPEFSQTEAAEGIRQKYTPEEAAAPAAPAAPGSKMNIWLGLAAGALAFYALTR